MRFAPPSYSEGDTISSQESTDEISTSSFHIASEERLSMVLQSDNMSIDGVAQGQINALINELIEEMGTKGKMVELITFMRDKPLNERSDSSVPQIAMLNFSFTTTYASEVQA
ncbi:hypothetical protein HI914_05595 [Erysiphe necator]|nr:hypothetical protein HI914_05595 [Erysiphe necator]